MNTYLTIYTRIPDIIAQQQVMLHPLFYQFNVLSNTGPHSRITHTATLPKLYFQKIIIFDIIVIQRVTYFLFTHPKKNIFEYQTIIYYFLK